MITINNFWPWKELSKLKAANEDLRREVEVLRGRHLEAVSQLQGERSAHDQTKLHTRKLGAIMAMRAGISISCLLLFCLSGFGQPVLRQWWSTNWTPLTYDTGANIDATVWPKESLMFTTDGRRSTIGDGVTSGGIVYGVRYWQAPSNALISASRPGELAVSANGLLGSMSGGPTLWINAGLGAGSLAGSNGTNWIPVISVLGNTVGTAVFSSPYVAALTLNYGTTGISDTGGTGGTASTLNICIISSGNAGNATNNATGGNAGDSGGFQFQGGNGGWATGVGSIGGGGGGGSSFQVVAGNGGNASNGFQGGNGGQAGNYFANGGNGGNDTVSGNGASGGSSGISTLSGGSAEVNTAGASVAGGIGGSITTSGVGTNAGGLISTTAVFHKRPGGSLKSFASTYLPTTLFTTTTTAGPSATSSETSLLGTPQFLAASSAQNQGLFIGSNIVDHAGRTLRFKLSGYIATSLTPTLEIKLKIGATTIIDTGAQTLVGISGNETWTFEGEVTCRTIGASGTWIGQGVFQYFSANTTLNGFSVPNTGTSTISTLVDQALDCTATFSANNTMQCTSAIFMLVN